MVKLGSTRRYLSGMPALLIGWAWAAACLLLPHPAQAICLKSADAGIRPLQALVGVDATGALKQTQTQLASLQLAPRPNSARLAALYAVQAQSYSALELDGDAREAAAKGLALAP